MDERLGLFPLHDASLDGAQLRGCFVLRPRAPCTWHWGITGYTLAGGQSGGRDAEWW
ncbi:MAG: hypothetical protein QOE48_6665 [Mycobacterium sp.]|jgi:hypothetical protein|nr:hypothetical protein [Mycobacterium sp.]MDT5310938.1 hypothetical protein [Mycobacterium sp.]